MARPSPAAAEIRNRSPATLWIFFRSRWPTPKTHGHLRMPSTPGVRDCSGRYRIFPARRQMHAKKNKYAMPRFDRTVAATTPVRPATRGHGRMSHNGLFRLAPRWPSESAYRRKASSSMGWYLCIGIATKIYSRAACCRRL